MGDIDQADHLEPTTSIILIRIEMINLIVEISVTSHKSIYCLLHISQDD